MDDGLWWAGQAQGLIESVATCKEIVTGVVADAEKAIGRLADLRG
ncbi:hypothetical protein [Streptomyces sp. NPDC056069]